MRLLVDWNKPHLATVEYVLKREDMLGGDKASMAEVRLSRLSSKNQRLEGRTGKVYEGDGRGKLVVQLDPERIGGRPELVRVPLDKLDCRPGGKEFLRGILEVAPHVAAD